MALLVREHNFHSAILCTTTLGGIGFHRVLVAIAFDLVTIRTLFSAVIITFFVNGSMDAADGYLGLKTRIDRSWNKLTSTDKVIAQAGLKVFVGALLLLAALFGLAMLVFI